MRDVLEEIITHPENVDPQTLAEIQRYTKLFWINTGPYNNLTARKFVLKCTPEAFAARPRRRRRRAARRSRCEAGESLEALLKRLQPMFFDLTVDPIVTNKTPGAGKDILASSANNLYVGVTMKDLDGFEREAPAELAAGEDRTASSSKRSIASAASTTRRFARSSDTSRRRSRLRPSRWRRRSGRS